jgi:mannose-6-phosphate isomerase
MEGRPFHACTAPHQGRHVERNMMPGIKLQPTFVEKIWGKDTVPNHPIDKLGKRIGELRFGRPERINDPLLVKYVYTNPRFAFQTHPWDLIVQPHGLAGGRTQSWYILDAEPGARVGIGTTRPQDQQSLRSAAQNGVLEHAMDWCAVQAGDFFFIPPGTPHVIGSGISLVGIQHDAGLPDELHAVPCPPPIGSPTVTTSSMPSMHRPLGCTGVLLSDGGFGLRLMHMHSGDLIQITNAGLAWFIPLRGRGDIDGQTWRAGECWLLTQARPAIHAASDADYLFATI